MSELPAVDRPISSDLPQRWLRQVFGLDTRSLAAMRIGLGLLLLANLGELAGEIPAFYTDAGVLPRAARMQLNLEEQFTAPPYWCSLHMLSGEAWFQGVLFAVSAALALCVVVGYRTRWTMFGSWVLLVSLQARTPLVLQGGDDMLRCLVFWSLFLPLGARWSIDSRHAPTDAPTWIWSWASTALLIQLICIYAFTALLKKHGMWRTEFTAIYVALSGDHFTTQLGKALLDYPTLLKGLTLGTIVLETAGPLMLLFPWRSWKVRAAVAASFCLLHVGIGATLSIGLFPATCIVYWLAVLPGEFWELACWKRLASWSMRPRPDAGRPLNPSLSATIESPSWAQNVLIAALISYVVLLNVTRLTPTVYVHLPASPLKTLGDAAALDQFWCMFSPRPHAYGGWFNVRGTLANGQRVNLFHPLLPEQAARPPLVSATYPSLRWRKLLVNLFERDCPTYRRSVGEYFVQRWNASHAPDEQVVTADIIAVMQAIEASDRAAPSYGPDEPMLLWHWDSPTKQAVAKTGE